MTVRELDRRVDAAGRTTALHVELDGREYLLVAWRATQSVAVYAGRWIRDRRTVGRNFGTTAAMVAHYRRDGERLADLAIELGTIVETRDGRVA